MDALDFAGRSVVVTGGTRGIGAGIACAFLAAGADVLVCGRRSPEALPRVGDRQARFTVADVRDPAQAQALIETAVRHFGRLDVLVNNAGGAPFTMADTASPRLHAKIIELNLIAPLHVSQAANAVMQRQESGGAIVMVGSVSGVRPSPGTAAYGAAKAGLHHLVASLAVEWAPRVRVNTVVAGPVDTSAAATADDDGLVAGHVSASAVARTVPMGRAARPAEVADACLFLASPSAGFISGAALAVHGGGEWPGYLAEFRPEQ